MKLSDPFTKDELITAVGSLQKNLAETFENIPEALFFQKPESGWSLAENIQHMNRVTRLLTLTFSTPKILASVFFGTNSSRARRTMEVAEIYL
ncbi:MAG: DinB family protein, partial [Leptospira sp.]|nr:DinB family protein [Leptospira sp.]